MPLAALLLAAGLGTGWVTSFRYPDMRSSGPLWSQTVAMFERLCWHRPASARADLYPTAGVPARSPVPCAYAGPPAARWQRR